jgi:hypothetical protein
VRAAGKVAEFDLRRSEGPEPTYDVELGVPASGEPEAGT